MQTDGPPFMGGEMLGRREYQDKGGSLTNLKTGATAAMLGLSDEGTRMYERHGLVYPARDEVSGYRSFDIMDVVMLQSARAYRQAGFTLEKTSELVHGGTVEELACAYESLVDELERDLAYLRAQTEYVRLQAAWVRDLPTSVGVCTLVERPGLYRFEYMSDGGIDLGEGREETMAAWAAYSPFAMISTRYPCERIADGTMLRDAYGVGVISGLGVFEKYAKLLGIQAGPHVVYWPAVRAIHTVTLANNNGLNPDFAPVRDFAAENGLTVTGDALSFAIASLDYDGEFDRYCHLWVPCA